MGGRNDFGMSWRKLHGNLGSGIDGSRTSGGVNHTTKCVFNV
jgi:hypothetical protein